MAGKKVGLITGATNGVGRAGALALAKQGMAVVLVGRDERRCVETVAEVQRASGNAEVSFLKADLSLVAEVRRVATEFRAKYDRLDVLVNNAGAVFQGRGTTAEGYERTFSLNHLAYFTLTTALLDLLQKSAPSRVVNVSSGAHLAGHIFFDDLHLERGYSAFRSYNQSKLANVLFTKELARRLEGTGVLVNAMHPGFVASGFALNNGTLARLLVRALRPFARTPEKAARTLVYLATSPEVQGSGGYYQDCKPARVSREGRDAEVAQRLWAVSERLVQEAQAA